MQSPFNFNLFCLPMASGIADEQFRLDEFMSDANFPLPGPDEIDLEFDFDFDATEPVKAGIGSPATPCDSILDQQYGAVAALATQASLV